jgi:hypothetical protein
MTCPTTCHEVGTRFVDRADKGTGIHANSGYHPRKRSARQYGRTCGTCTGHDDKRAIWRRTVEHTGRGTVEPDLPSRERRPATDRGRVAVQGHARGDDCGGGNSSYPTSASGGQKTGGRTPKGVWHYTDALSRRSTSFRINQCSGAYTKGTGYSTQDRHRG